MIVRDGRLPFPRAVSVFCGVVLLALAPVIVPADQAAAAEDMPLFKIEMHDAIITPAQVAVPANAPFKLEITNAGVGPGGI